MNTDKLNKQTVLVLNRNWQAINTRSPIEAFGQMAADSATGLDIHGDSMIPTKWDQWLQLPVRDHDDSVGTANGKVRIPTVIVLSNFAKVPLKRPRFGLKGLWERDGGICQYTGRVLGRSEGNIDHVIPRSKGGPTTWENCVLADKRVNSRKGNRTPREAGLRLKKDPVAPCEIPITAFLRNTYEISDWNHFLISKS